MLDQTPVVLDRKAHLHEQRQTLEGGSQDASDAASNGLHGVKVMSTTSLKAGLDSELAVRLKITPCDRRLNVAVRLAGGHIDVILKLHSSAASSGSAALHVNCDLLRSALQCGRH